MTFLFSPSSIHFVHFLYHVDDVPDVREMRCVPTSWCVKSKFVPVKVWDDSGAGGGKPGSMWIINSLQMMAIVPGHDAPRDDYYDINSARFFLEGFQMSNSNISSK